MNGEKLFKSMNNINQEWIEQAKPANKPVIMRTRSKIYRNIAAGGSRSDCNLGINLHWCIRVPEVSCPKE